MKITAYAKCVQSIFKCIGTSWYYLVIGLTTIISCLALYYSELPFRSINIILSTTYLIFCYFCLVKNKWSKSMIGIWWLSLIGIWFFYNITTQPSNDRNWRADVNLPARAIIDGDTINIINFRQSGDHKDQLFIPHYIEREVSLSKLTSIDFYVSYWMPGPVAHTFIGFNFSDAPPVFISIEARYEEHESYAPIASLFRQFELIYVVGDEENVVDLRVNHRNEDVYRYRLNVSAEHAQRLFKEYIYRINELADYPEFYNLLRSNCTINIFRYATQAGLNESFNYRLLLNGLSDRFLYNAGLINNDRPFSELRREAYIAPKSIAQ